MDIFGNLILGFSVSLSLYNLWFCFVGVLVGTIIGVLPGIGPTATIALVMPVTFGLPSVTAIIMLSGIYYGAMYGGSTTSILVNIPGEAASVVTCLDGYEMAKQGRAGPALGISAFGSFIAGTISIFGLALFAPSVANVALKFGAPDYFALVCVGLVAITFLGQGSMLKSLIMVFVGLLLSTVGRDLITSYPRFTFGLLELEEGFEFVPIIMGLFGLSEILINIEKSVIGVRDIYKKGIMGLLPSLKDWAISIGPILRGTVFGFFMGVLPGGGATLASFGSYMMEKRISNEPETFGRGAIQGVAGPESANNAGAQGSFIPLLTLGIPSNSVMAVLLGAFMIHGIQPGPLMMSQAPDLFWGVITSMYIGNLMLLILNLPLIGIWVRMLRVPYSILFPLILIFCIVGSYSINNRIFEIYIMGIFGAVGYILRKLDFELAPLILAFVLGDMLEDKLRHSLLIYHGNLTVFITRPIAAFFLGIAFLLLILQLVPSLRRAKSSALKGTSEFS
jgi:putative tricarboxylic transport membrane protein